MTSKSLVLAPVLALTLNYSDFEQVQARLSHELRDDYSVPWASLTIGACFLPPS